MIKQTMAMLILGSAFASGMAAALPIDQSQTDTSVAAQSGVVPVQGLLQSFQPTQDNVAGAGFYFGRVADAPIDVTIAIWNGLPYGGSQIASATVQLSAIGWLDAFWTSVSVTPGATYFLAATVSTEPGPVEPAVASDDYTNSYANGSPYTFDPTSRSCCRDLADFGFDYAFRTYYEPTETEVPEPGTLALLGLGLAGLGLSRRRKAA